MSLKKALIAFTNENGDDVSRVLTIKDVVFKYEESEIEIIYRSRPQDPAKAALAGDKFISHRVSIDLATNPTGMGMVEQASELIWQMAANVPLVQVPVLNEETGVRSTETKSILDLGTIVEA